MQHNVAAVVIALGNRFRQDDGVALAVAEQLHHRRAPVTIVAGQDDALAIINAWEGAALVMIVDAAHSGSIPGTIHRLQIGVSPVPKNLARCSSHGVGLAEALELAKVMGRLPTRLLIYAVEIETCQSGVALSPAVAAAVQQVVEFIETEIASFNRQLP